ncbi:MAG: hypothetical protein ACRD22_19020, partial [Terriglobia bacterium]
GALAGNQGLVTVTGSGSSWNDGQAAFCV